MQTVAHLNSVTLHPSHRSKYVRLRLANGVLFIEGSIGDDKNSWSDLIEKRQLFDEPVAGRILQDIRRSRKEASSKFEKAALKEIERMFTIMRGQNAMKTKKPKYVSKRPKLITVDDTYGHATPPKPKFSVWQTVYFTWKHKPEHEGLATVYSTETGRVSQILQDSQGFRYILLWRCSGLRADFSEDELSADQGKAKEVYIPEMIKFTMNKKIRDDIKAGEAIPVPQMSLFKTAELIDELKRRGLGVFSLSMPFQYIPKQKEEVMTYRLKQGKKLQFINVLYGRPPENFTDLTKLTFMKADCFDPSHLKANEGYFKCIQFEWVFIADLDELVPFLSRHK